MRLLSKKESRAERIFLDLVGQCIWETIGSSRIRSLYDSYAKQCLALGKEIPDKYLPGRLILRLSSNDRLALQSLRSSHIQHRDARYWGKL